MTPQSDALTLIVGAINQQLGIGICIGALPVAGGTSAELAGGVTEARTLDLQSGITKLTVLFYCKSTSQSAALDTLCSVANFLNRLTDKPASGTVQIVAIEANVPLLVAHAGDYYIYTLNTKITIFY